MRIPEPDDLLDLDPNVIQSFFRVDDQFGEKCDFSGWRGRKCCKLGYGIRV